MYIIQYQIQCRKSIIFKIKQLHYKTIIFPTVGYPIFRDTVVYQKFSFVIELLIEPKNGGKILYVYPFTGSRKIYRKITDEFSDLPNITSKLDITKKPEQYIHDCIRLKKICFSDNLTGSDFNNVLKAFNIL